MSGLTILREGATIEARRAIGFCDIRDDGVEWVPPRPARDVDPESNSRLKPETCQEVWTGYSIARRSCLRKTATA